MKDRGSQKPSRPPGFEPGTSPLRKGRSIQLSYGPKSAEREPHGGREGQPSLEANDRPRQPWGKSTPKRRYPP